MPLRVAVVGSGFAAWGTVLALAGKPDVSLHVFDIGLVTADASRSERPVPNAKPCGGSFFCYGFNDSRFPLRLDSARMCSSHALGGHSVVYSGAILYPRDADLANWPAESRPRAEDYAAVLARLPLLKDRDAIEDAFPTVPSQADLAGKPPLHAEASVLGMSRLAVSEFAGAVRPFSLCDEFRTLHPAALAGGCRLRHAHQRRHVFPREGCAGLVLLSMSGLACSASSGGCQRCGSAPAPRRRRLPAELVLSIRR